MVEGSGGLSGRVRLSTGATGTELLINALDQVNHLAGTEFLFQKSPRSKSHRLTVSFIAQQANGMEDEFVIRRSYLGMYAWSNWKAFDALRVRNHGGAVRKGFQNFHLYAACCCWSIDEHVRALKPRLGAWDVFVDFYTRGQRARGG
jgi:hypothetical protein